MTSKVLTNYTDTTFLNCIKEYLRTCESFRFTVSFIKKAGLVLLWNDLKSSIERGAKGELITSTYQNFTDIESLKLFHLLSKEHSNFSVHLDDECFWDEKNFEVNGFHSKGYIFSFADGRTDVIIGSSNISRFALLKNVEWDLVVTGDRDSSAYFEAMKEFDYLWSKTYQLSNDLIEKYATKLNFAIERWDMDYDLAAHAIKPNFMQRKALRELNRYRAIGENKSLIVAATGSGKTYLAAFDALNFDPDRLLYVVHEESILNKSFETFQDVFGSSKKMGKMTGENKDIDADYIFSTYQTLIRSLDFFSKDYFDYIIIDECHHATSPSFRKILSHFNPQFLLGLTATPERMDKDDVLGLFDNNIPYELRIRDALINDLIVPFHYYGIRDTLVEYGLTGKQEYKMISQLATEEHCDFIGQQIEEHRDFEGKLKALAFCRSIQHARMMAEGMGDKYKTAYLTGKNDAGERLRAYNDLQSDKEGTTEILFAVDILNEGVDIPCVNTVLFLRPTESSTIFIQQLGRGLRKYEGKKHVNVLDFIGNDYKRSVQIALALGSLSKNYVMEKRLMCSLVADNFRALGLEDYGVQINIDQLSKTEIMSYIENENFYKQNYIRSGYDSFKRFLNCQTYPKHVDYLNSDYAPDLMTFMKIKIANKKTGSYYGFLKGIGEENIPVFSESQEDLVNYLSGLLHLVRKDEYIIARCLLNGIHDKDSIMSAVLEEGGTSDSFGHAIKYMIEDGILPANDDQLEFVSDISPELKEFLLDLIEYGLVKYESTYAETEEDFVLWQNYRYDQVQRKVLKNPGYNGKGTYIYGDKVYIFASIKKDITDEEKQHLNYKDKFIEADVFQWECEDYRASHWSESKILEEHNKLTNSKEAYLFIRKVDNQHGIQMPFIYVGTGKMSNPVNTDKNDPCSTVIYKIKMDSPLPDDLQYDFELSRNLLS